MLLIHWKEQAMCPRVMGMGTVTGDFLVEQSIERVASEAVGTP